MSALEKGIKSARKEVDLALEASKKLESNSPTSGKSEGKKEPGKATGELQECEEELEKKFGESLVPFLEFAESRVDELAAKAEACRYNQFLF